MKVRLELHARLNEPGISSRYEFYVRTIRPDGKELQTMIDATAEGFIEWEDFVSTVAAITAAGKRLEDSEHQNG